MDRILAASHLRGSEKRQEGLVLLQHPLSLAPLRCSPSFPSVPEGRCKVTLGQARRTARRPHAGLGLPPAGSSWGIGGRGRMPRTAARGARTPFLTTRRDGRLFHGGTGWEALVNLRGRGGVVSGPRTLRVPTGRQCLQPGTDLPSPPAWPRGCRWKRASGCLRRGEAYRRAVRLAGRVGAAAAALGKPEGT